MEGWWVDRRMDKWMGERCMQITVVYRKTSLCGSVTLEECPSLHRCPQWPLHNQHADSSLPALEVVSLHPSPTCPPGSEHTIPLSAGPGEAAGPAARLGCHALAVSLQERRARAVHPACPAGSHGGTGGQRGAEVSLWLVAGRPPHTLRLPLPEPGSHLCLFCPPSSIWGPFPHPLPHLSPRPSGDPHLREVHFYFL